VAQTDAATFSQRLGLTGLMHQFRNKIGNHSLEVLNARSTSSRWLHCCDGSENRGSNLGAEQDSYFVMGGGDQPPLGLAISEVSGRTGAVLCL